MTLNTLGPSTVTTINVTNGKVSSLVVSHQAAECKYKSNMVCA